MQVGHLRLVRGHDQLAAAAVGDATLGTVGVQQIPCPARTAAPSASPAGSTCPAWITSLLRELVPVPIASAASSTTTSRPCSASARATASPTTPAPITTTST
jgi:hypothetical protein